MNKSEAYKELFSLKSQGVNVDSYLTSLATSHGVPQEVKELLRNQSTCTEKFRSLIESLQGKKFYSSLYSSEVNEQAKGLSSLLTHLLIEMGKNPSIVPVINTSLDIGMITTSLSSYITNNDSSAISEAVVSIQDLLKED